MHTEIQNESTMNFGLRFRLAALAVGVGLMGGLIVWATLHSQRLAADVRSRLNHLDMESFGIADHFKDSLRNLNATMLRYGMRHNQADWDAFLKGSEALDHWIDSQKETLGREPEKDTLQKIDVAYDDYVRIAGVVHAQVEALNGQDAKLAAFTDFLDQAQRLFDLGQTLAKTHYDSRNLVRAHANKTLTQLRQLVLGLLCLLFVLGVALAFGVYKNIIAPLQVKLGESRAQAERHEKLASLGMLAAGVAHEIRNPLTAIKAALFIQQKKFLPGSPEYADAELVEREILRLERIVSNILQFARPAEPELATVPADVPLREVQSLLAPQLAKANISLVCRTSEFMKIKADPAQIKQVLINLVQNAADSMSAGGTITLRARQSRNRMTESEMDVVILEVEDTGQGIPPEVEKRLFDPFFTTKESGTGLGLSIAARIVEKHGGSLKYRTQMHHGTTFGVVLPQVTA